MRYFLYIFSLILVIFSITTTSVQAISVQVNNGEFTIDLQKERQNIETQEVFKLYAELLGTEIPSSYTYINLRFTNITSGTVLEDSLKKLVYLDVIKNVPVPISYTQSMQAKSFYKLSEVILGIDTSTIPESSYTGRTVSSHDVATIKKIYTRQYGGENMGVSKSAIFNDVYSIIKTDYYGKDTITDDQLIDGAIKGLAEGAGDKHTVYFPKSENKVFQQALNGNFQGIGAYVDMSTPGEFIIVSPLPDSPAAKAGLQPGDKVVQVDDFLITESATKLEVINWIKGPEGTKVTLKIQRENQVFSVEIIREKVHVSSVEGQKKGNDTYYLQIRSFGAQVANEFVSSLAEIKADARIKKLIIDLRNNGGGYLGEVNKILSHLVPQSEPITTVEYLKDKGTTYSQGFNTLDIGKYEVIILVNNGTASASEILAATLKDYFPDIVILGTKTYGKGSVQSIKQYPDGSSFKYTVAKWFTGKTHTGIDGIGITPDIKLEYDFDAEEDNQLQKAIEL